MDFRTEFRRLEPLVSEVLWRDWDPIGVNTSPEARGEYEGYVPQVLGAVMRGASAAEIAALLIGISEEMIGIPETEAAHRAARALVALK